jgi:hypothetical protein
MAPIAQATDAVADLDALQKVSQLFQPVKKMPLRE